MKIVASQALKSRWQDLLVRGRLARFALCGAIGMLCATSAHADAQAETVRAMRASLQLKTDIVDVAAGGLERGVRHVDTLDLALDADLQSVLGWDDVVAHLDLLVSGGGAPNDLAGTLQGVNNAEVSTRRTRLYQAWAEKSFANVNLRLGFSDLNTEFDVADSAGLLLGASFGVGGELAGTGSGGPSLYPSTALGLRLRLDASGDRYWQAAIVNARAGVVGDKGAPDLAFKGGVLAMGEIGWTGRNKVAIGLWGYSQEPTDIRAVDAAGSPRRTPSWGAYGVIEHRFSTFSSSGRATTGFLKAGLSDGRTTDVAASWQTGIFVNPAWPSRPGSAASIGLGQAWLARPAIANRREAGLDPAYAETQLEITYSEKLTRHLAVQPDLQLIWHRDAMRGEPLVLAASVRLTVAY